VQAVRETRRDVLKAAIGSAAAFLLSSRRLGAQPASLIERAIPSSGERLPVIGIGTARRWEQATTPAEMAPLRDVLRQFAERGGKVIDTAPSYGNAEALVGELVGELGIRPSLFLATKVGAVGREAGLQEIETSFRRLRTPRIDLVAVHNLRDIATQLRTLRELKQSGRIRYVGMTTSFPQQYPEFERTMRTETLDFIQVDYALDNRAAASTILPLAADRGMAVMINLPFGRGRLFQAVQGRELPPWASSFDCASWAQFFLKWIVGQPAVTCVIPATRNPAHVADNLGAASGPPPDEAMRRRMSDYFRSL
jgi:aryl-alcohol dehydrogenase-like predicted oxidoreductase